MQDEIGPNCPELQPEKPAPIEPESGGGRTLLVWLGLTLAVVMLHGALRAPGEVPPGAGLEYFRPSDLRSQAGPPAGPARQTREICREVHRHTAGAVVVSLGDLEAQAVGYCKEMGLYSRE